MAQHPHVLAHAQKAKALAFAVRDLVFAADGVNGAHAFPSSAKSSEALHFDLMFLERIPDLAGCQAQQACGFGLNPAGFLHRLDQHLLAKMR